MRGGSWPLGKPTGAVESAAVTMASRRRTTSWTLTGALGPGSGRGPRATHSKLGVQSGAELIEDEDLILVRHGGQPGGGVHHIPQHRVVQPPERLGADAAREQLPEARPMQTPWA